MPETLFFAPILPFYAKTRRFDRDIFRFFYKKLFTIRVVYDMM